MSVFFLKLARTVLFLSSSPLTFRSRRISSMVVLALHGEVAKALMVRLATHKLIFSVNAVVGIEFLSTTLADRRWRGQRLKSLVKDITGVNLLFLLVLCPLKLIPPSNNNNFLINLSLTPADPGARQ